MKPTYLVIRNQRIILHTDSLPIALSVPDSILYVYEHLCGPPLRVAAAEMN